MRAERIDAEARILQQDKLLALVDACLPNCELIAPVDESSYRAVHSADEIYLSDDKPARSPKEFVFPQREVLLQYALSAEKTTIATPQSSSTPERVLPWWTACSAS